MPKEAIHPSIKEAITNIDPSKIKGGKGDDFNVFRHPKIEDLVIEHTKQLGVHFSIDLVKEEGHLTYTHWGSHLEKTYSLIKVLRNSMPQHGIPCMN